MGLPLSVHFPSDISVPGSLSVSICPHLCLTLSLSLFVPISPMSRGQPWAESLPGLVGNPKVSARSG